MSLSQTKHVIAVRRTIDVSKDGNVETVLEVTTDLELDSTKEGFDSSSLDDIVDALVKEMKNAPSIDRGMIKTI